MKYTYTTVEGLRNRMKNFHHMHFDTAFTDDSFDDPALYEPFVLYGQLELMLNTILYDFCGKILSFGFVAKISGDSGTDSSRCDWYKMRENKNSLKRYVYILP